jgi:orotate phosphoribosyltransferase/orotidine-5'-phosphate decarboxylase
MLDVSDAILAAKALHVNVIHQIVHRGISTPMYCDCRELFSQPVQRTIVAEALTESIEPLVKMGCSAVAGVAVAGIPWAAIIAHRLHIPLLVVRSERKEQGTRRLVEGDVEKGSQVVIIDDVLFSGAALRHTIRALREAQLCPKRVVTILSYGNRSLITSLRDDGVETSALLAAEHLVASALSTGAVSADEAAVCHAFIEKVSLRTEHVRRIDGLLRSWMRRLRRRGPQEGPAREWKTY